MKSRLQKKHRRLLAENKLLKGQLSEEIKLELAGGSYPSRRELEALQQEITGYRHEWKGDQMRLEQYGLQLLEQEKALTDVREEIERRKKHELEMTILLAVLLFCQIVNMFCV